MPPQKDSRSAPKADASEKAKATDRDWLTTAELAAKIGWGEHALRDALRGKDLPGVRRTSFGYHIDASALEQIKTTLGAPPPKRNASKWVEARFRSFAGRICSSSRYFATVLRARMIPCSVRSFSTIS